MNIKDKKINLFIYDTNTKRRDTFSKRKKKIFNLNDWNVRFRRLYWQVILHTEVKFSVIVDQPGKEDKICHQQRTY